MPTLDVTELLRDIGLNIVALVVLVFGSYYRNYRRWDQVVAYVAFNICLFTVSASLGSSAPINVGVGFGLFGVLSIIRLRSDEATPIEIGYTMVSLVLGLMSGLSGMEFEVKCLFAGLLVGVMVLIDLRGARQTRRFERVRVEIDRVFTDQEHLAAHLATVFPVPVTSVTVRDIDMVRDVMRLEVVLDRRPLV